MLYYNTIDNGTLYINDTKVCEIETMELKQVKEEIKTSFAGTGTLNIKDSNNIKNIIKSRNDYIKACNLSSIYNRTKKPRVKKKLLKRLYTLDVNFDLKLQINYGY